ncbi:MAG TPA: hypothetical protein VN253_29955 [Kofleriaceae bacterium]|nr:hypothetical protein [Kofleriaceae bacterium]
MLVFAGVLVLAGGSMGSSCISNIAKDATAQAVDVLDRGITTISNNSQVWNNTLTTMISQLTDKAQSTVRTELTNLLNGSITLASTEVRCDIDFLGKRVVQALRRIKATLLRQPPPDVLEPHVCSAVPAAIDFQLWQTHPDRVQSVSLYGFDLDEQSLALWLIDKAGNRDMTASMVKTSSCQLIINLGGNGVKLTSTSNKLTLVARGDQAHPVGEVAVIQPNLPLCQTQFKDVIPAALPKYIPPASGGGDQDFSGHGPVVTAEFNLFTVGPTLKAVLFINARETVANFTEAEGQVIHTLWNADPGWAIDSIVSSAYSEISYTDMTAGEPGTAADDRFFGGNGPVASWICTGDTMGNDAGVKTGCTVSQFNVIRLKLRQTQNCVSAQSAVRMLNSNQLSPETRDHLKALLPPQ